jgi:hypothetical protein
VDKFTRGYHKKVFDRNIKGKNTYVKDWYNSKIYQSLWI